MIMVCVVFILENLETYTLKHVTT